jgi:CSLREA domain-containing protein
LEDRVLLAIFTVNSIADPGNGTCDVAECTLREAITAANNAANGGTPDEIRFGISGAGPHTILPSSALPTIIDPVIIDGYSQAGSSMNSLAGGNPAVLKLELNGTNADSANGLEITGGGSTVKGLVINRFPQSGIRIAGSGGNRIEGNFIGTNVAGAAALENGGQGVQVFASPNHTIGGTTAAARNLISGNSSCGVEIGDNFGGGGSTGNRVSGNFIGTDVTGTLAVGNACGVEVFNAANNTVGGPTAAERNIVSGNRGGGVNVGNPSPDNVVQNNFIGTDVTGTHALGNGGGAMDVANAPRTQILNNVISANRSGISFHNPGTNDNIVRGNRIGTDVTGTLNLGNRGRGLDLCCSANGTQIGGPNVGDGNIIAFNAEEGIYLENSSSVTIIGNRFFANGRLGIEIRPEGVGGGPAVPVITSVTENAGTTTIRGTLDSSGSSQFRLEFFANAEPDPSVSGEGEIFLGAVSQSTDGSGHLDFMADFPTASVPAGSFLTATATGPNNETSEFSRAFLPGADQLPAVQIVTNTNDTGPGSLRRAMFNANFHANGGTPDEIRFDIPAATDPGCVAATGVCTIRPNGVLPSIVDPVVIDGYTQTGSQQNANRTDQGLGLTTMLKIVINGANAGTPGLHITAGNSTVRGLVINGFSEDGIRIETGGGNTITGNFIGTDVTGTAAVPNGSSGIQIFRSSNNVIGGNTAPAANLISGNNNAGVEMGSGTFQLDVNNNLVAGNFVGVDITGRAALGNGGGVQIFNAPDNTIGGPTTAHRNIISGNRGGGAGVGQLSDRSVVQNNFVGTDVTGTIGLGNAGEGIEVSNTADARVLNNLVSANSNHGISLHNPSTQRPIIQGNRVGTDITGVFNLGNGGRGVSFSPSAGDGLVGGTNVGEENIIAFNGMSGVFVQANSNNVKILGNSIFDNGLLGIDLGFNDEDGVGDQRNRQSVPALTSVTRGSVTIQGSLNSDADTTFRIEFFDNRRLDPSDFGEGRTFIGSVNVTTDGSGNAPINAFFGSYSLPAGHFVTSTATRLDGGGNPVETSEFSAPPPAVTGQKFQDVNGNGVKDTGEPTLDGWVIRLFDDQGTELGQSTTTSLDLDGSGSFDASERGIYQFENLTAGTFTVREDNQPGFQQTAPGGPTFARIVTLTSSDPVGTAVDFGNVELNSIRGTKFRDLLDNGFGADDLPLDGTLIDLFRDDGDGVFTAADGAAVATATSGQVNPGTGVFVFGNLGAGRYFVQERVPAGFIRTGGPAFYTIDLVAGGISLGNDFANFQPGEIRGLKFLDINADGIKQTNEPGIPGWTIQLRNLATGQVQTAVTGAGGAYSFTRLVAGNYSVTEVTQSGLTQTAPSLLRALYGAKGEDSGASTLYSIDSTSGAATAIGPIGFDNVGGMDFDPASGTLFAVAHRSNNGTRVLITINPFTGAGTEVGPLGSGGNVQDISFRNSDSTLFAFFSQRTLGTINASTGALTSIGGSGSGSGNGIAFNANDVLFHGQDSSLNTINLTNGARTFVASLSRQRMNAMDFDPLTGILYGSLNEGTNYLSTIDTSTGAVTRIGQTATNVDALAWSALVRPHNVTLGIGQLVTGRDFGNTTDDGDFDNDGIPDALDTQPLAFSNDFSDGTTSGTVTRNGWTVTVSDLAATLGVRVAITGNSNIRADIDVCPASGSEQVRLNAANETADITCGPPSANNGSATVTAVVTANQIVVRKPPGGAVAARLDQGETATIGSPVTAGPGSTIDVDLDDDDDDDNEPPGTFQLEENESADVEVTAEDEVEITMLVGDTTVVIAGMTAELSEGESQSFSVGTITVAIDIKPKDRRNLISLFSNDSIPVAILSSDEFFAVTRVDRTSLTFGRTGDEMSLLACSRRTVDVNRDGLADLTCNFKRNRTGFQPGDTVGTLRGETIDGTPLEGSDVVLIKPRLRARSVIAAHVATPDEPDSPNGPSPRSSRTLSACMDESTSNHHIARRCNADRAATVDAAIASFGELGRRHATGRLETADAVIASVLDLLGHDLI